MTSGSLTPQQVDSLLSAELEATQQLVQALEREFTALNQNSTEQLDAVVDAKREALARLEALETSRLNWLAGCGCDNSDAGMLTALGQLPESDTITAHWQQVRDTANQCRLLNERNGHTVNLKHNHLRRALDLLTGRPATVTYGPEGKPTDSGESRTITKA